MLRLIESALVIGVGGLMVYVIFNVFSALGMGGFISGVFLFIAVIVILMFIHAFSSNNDNN